MLPRKGTAMQGLLCVMVLLQIVSSQSMGQDPSTILLSSLDPKELDNLLDAKLEELQMDIFKDYQEHVKEYQNTVDNLQRHRRDIYPTPAPPIGDPVAILPRLDDTFGHSYRFDTRVGARQVVKIDSFELVGFLGAVQVTEVFPLQLTNLSAIYKGKDGLGYIIKDGMLKVLKVRNEWTASTSGCRCDGSSPPISRSHESCACCIPGSCLCTYALGFDGDACVPCGSEKDKCPKASSKDLQLDAAVGFEYVLPNVGLQQIVITAKSTLISFYRVDEFELQIVRSATGLSTLTSLHPVTHLGYGEVFVDYHGVLKRKRFLIAFCAGQEFQQLHELMVGTYESAIAVGLSRVWQASGTAMRVSQSGGRLIITVLEGQGLDVFELKEDLWREFEFQKVQRLNLDRSFVSWSFFSTGFENYIILVLKTEVQIYIHDGAFYQPLRSIGLDGAITVFDNFLALNMKSCRNEVVFVAGSGSIAAVYVLDWSTKISPSLRKVNVYKIEVDGPLWRLAVGFFVEDHLRLVIPGQTISAVYAIRAHLEEVKDPIWKENLLIEESIKNLKDEYRRQTIIMDRAQERLSKSVDVNFNIRGNVTISQSIYVSRSLVTNVLVANKITLPGTDMTGGNFNDYGAYLAQFNATQKRLNASLAQLTSIEIKLTDILASGGTDRPVGGYITIINPGLNLETLFANNINIGRVLDINGAPVSLVDILRGLVRVNSGNKITGRKIFANGLTVGELRTDFLDDIPVSDLVTLRDEQTILGAIYQSVFVAQNIILKPGALIGGVDLSKSIQLNVAAKLGNVIFQYLSVEGNVQVTSNTVNGIDISRLFQNALLLSGGEVLGSLAFTNELLISNLDATKIGGVNIRDFLNNIVYKDRAANLEGKLTVAGPVVVKNLQVRGKINNRSFPENYPIKSDTGPITFTGQKQFSSVKFGNLKFGPQGTVDGLDPNTLVTKSTTQLITGSKVFAKGISVEGNLEIPSKIIDGVNLDEITRIQARLPVGDVWKFDVVFTGSVTLPKLIFSGFLNGINFASFAKDILYDDGPAKLSGVKSFRAGLTVGDAQIIGTLNGEDVNALVTTTKNHLISGTKTFVQDVTFNSLTARRVDGEDLDELFRSAVYLDKDGQIVTGKKVFTNSVIISSLEVKGRLSNVDFSKVVTKSGNQQFTVPQILVAARFSSIQAQSINLMDDFTVNGIDLSELAARRLALKSSIDHTARLIIDGPFIVVGNLMTDRINGLSISQLEQNLVTDNTDSTINGPVTISDLLVTNSVLTSGGRGANGISLRDLSRKAVKLNGSNTFIGAIDFSELELRGNVGVRGLVNGVDLIGLRDDSVFINSDSLQKIMGTKTFVMGFDVKGNLDTKATNGVDLSTRLLTLNTDQHIQSYYGFESIIAKKNVILLGLFNDIDLRSLKSPGKKMSKYAGINFLGNVKIGELIIEGILDGINVTARLADAIRLSETGVFITGKKTFRANTQFTSLKVNFLNSVFLADYLANVVLRNSNKVLTTLLTIHGDVSAPWVTAENIVVEGSIDGVDYKALKRDVIYLNRQQNILTELIFERGIVVRGNINAINLNGRSLAEDYLTLRTEQFLNVDATLATIYSTFVEVGGLVNNLYLPLLKELTMQAVGGQIISGLTTMKGITRVLGNIEVTGRTGSDVLIKLSTDVIDLLRGGEINGLLRFTREVVTKTLTSSTSLVYGINLLELYNNAWYNDVASIITARLIFNDLVTFRLGLTVTGTIDRLNIGHLYNQTALVLAQFGASTTEIRAEYAAMCNSIVHLYKQLEDSLYEGECFEYVYTEVFPQLRHSSISFIAFNVTYLVLSYEGQCYSEVYIWNNSSKSFSFLVSLSTGYAHEWVHVETANGKVFLAAATSSTHNACRDTNSTIWEVTLNNIRLVKVLVAGEKVSKEVSSGRTFVHILGTYNTITYEYILVQDRWVEVYTSEPFDFILHVLDDRGIDVSFRSSSGGIGEIWVGGVSKQTTNLGYSIHDAVLVRHHKKIYLFVIVSTHIRKHRSYELKVYEVYNGLLDCLDSADLDTPGEISLFFVGNDVCESVYLAITQHDYFPVIYNFFSEALKEWSQLMAPRTTWIQYFAVPNSRFPRILDHYIILGRSDNSARVYTLLMRGSTVPKINYSCEIEAFTNPLLKKVQIAYY